MTRADFIAPPCGCSDCVIAGVHGKELVRDRQTGRWMHGLQLRRWYEARDRFFAAARAAVGSPKGQRTNAMTKLVQE